jgi:hypothetical protein
MVDKQKYETIVKIAERAENMGISKSTRMTLLMDLECATEQFNLRLSDLLEAPAFDFTHDICGIQANFNRRTKKMENCFVPRYSGIV